MHVHSIQGPPSPNVMYCIDIAWPSKFQDNDCSTLSWNCRFASHVLPKQLHNNERESKLRFVSPASKTSRMAWKVERLEPKILTGLPLARTALRARAIQIPFVLTGDHLVIIDHKTPSQILTRQMGRIALPRREGELRALLSTNCVLFCSL